MGGGAKGVSTRLSCFTRAGLFCKPSKGESMRFMSNRGRHDARHNGSMYDDTWHIDTECDNINATFSINDIVVTSSAVMLNVVSLNITTH